MKIVAGSEILCLLLLLVAGWHFSYSEFLESQIVMFLIDIWSLILCIWLSISLGTMLLYLIIIQAERTELTSPAKPI